MKGILPFLFLLIPINTFAIEIPDFVEDYISSNLSAYKIFIGNQRRFGESEISGKTPWSVTLDFNGDGIKDWVGFLVIPIQNNAHIKRYYDYQIDLLCICSGINKYNNILLERSVHYVDRKDNSISGGIFKVNPTTIESQVDGQESVVIKNSSIEWTDFEKVSIVYYLKDGELKKFWTSD